MANIFFAWELGSNLGHLMSILPVAAELQRQRHNVTLAVKDLAWFAQIDNRLQLTVVQSPLFFPPTHATQESLGYCDILAIGGYLADTSLLPLMLAWRQLFELTQADVIVCQHAPTALLASRSCGRSAVVIGSGFMCPPATVPLPGFTELIPGQRDRLTQTEAQILATCNKVLEKLAAPPLRNLADLFRGATTVLCIYPELDHYDARDNVEYFGPLYADTDTKPVLFPRRFEKNILIYLNDFKCWTNIRSAFAGMSANVLCIAVGLSAQEARQARAPHVSVVTSPIPLLSAYEQANLVVCHGGPGVVAGALAAAKPVLILPTQKEQEMLASSIARQGYGDYLDLDAPASKIRAAMEHLLSSFFDKTAIESYAARHRSSTMADRIQSIVNRILNTHIEGSVTAELDSNNSAYLN